MTPHRAPLRLCSAGCTNLVRGGGPCDEHRQTPGAEVVADYVTIAAGHGIRHTYLQGDTLPAHIPVEKVQHLIDEGQVRPAAANSPRVDTGEAAS